MFYSLLIAFVLGKPENGIKPCQQGQESIMDSVGEWQCLPCRKPPSCALGERLETNRNGCSECMPTQCPRCPTVTKTCLDTERLALDESGCLTKCVPKFAPCPKIAIQCQPGERVGSNEYGCPMKCIAPCQSGKESSSFPIEQTLTFLFGLLI